ncbi:MAG: retroviral-like aspartic protease family protein [Alphaproteobacteria bacterium]|nr:retroviral-like aspartic protease family protein [Alphaproteobacteria bacterium]MDE2340489.1 retroviral-like aspartic protease family protein [Alphaproteobacteria bacterium]
MKGAVRQAGIATLLMSLGVHAEAQAGSAPAQSGDTQATAILPKPDASHRLQIDVFIGNAGHYLFLVDTASTRSVIASRPAEQMHLRHGESLNVHNLGGTDRVGSVIIPDITFADVAAQNIVAPELSAENLGGDGLIGLDLLKGKRITVDFLNNAKITLTPSNRGRVHDATFGGPDTIVVHARSRIGELILTDAEIDGHKIAVVIDTGSQDSVGNDALRRLVARRIGESEVRPVTLVSVTGRKVPADYTTIGRVRIGGVALSNLSVAFADAATFHQFGLDRKPAILLGMAALRLFDRISIDFPRREIRFQLGQRAASNIH